MKIAVYEYKCRRCGGIQDNTETAADDDRHWLILQNTMLDVPVSINDKLSETTLHRCEDGGMGVADLQGFRIEEQE